MTPQAVACYAPYFCGGLGTLIGLLVQSCISVKTCLPVIIGSSTGAGVGCLFCVCLCIYSPDSQVNQTIAQPNLVYESGANKNTQYANNSEALPP